MAMQINYIYKETVIPLCLVELNKSPVSLFLTHSIYLKNYAAVKSHVCWTQFKELYNEKWIKYKANTDSIIHGYVFEAVDAAHSSFWKNF